MKATILIAGDLAAMLVITLIGFATHGEVQSSALGRMAVLFFPLAASWFLLAPWFGLFRPEVAGDIRQVWRPGLAMIFAAPAALVVRAMLLNSVLLWLFGVILTGTCALGMMLWRAVAVLVMRGDTNQR